ncbi:GtrA family protein [Candidatus Parcubacteria bacterium]|jgi:putative flippase GtrA|nr:MAG: GtrA family protein [Candidatus Parcubacteria bacterium]
MWNRILNHPLAQRPIARQFSKFVIIGFVNTGLDWAVFFALTSWVDWFELHVIAANIISFGCGFTSSFIFNRNWTFRSKDSGIQRQLAVFLGINLVGLALNSTILGVVYYLTHSRLLAKTLAVGITLFWNFLAARRWAFQRPQTSRGF